MGALIDLSGFRKRNNLSQAELAKAIGTSAAFISQVETGASKMPAEKLQTLERVAEEKHWSTRGLIPAWDRLWLLGKYIGDVDKDNRELDEIYSKDYPKLLNQTIPMEIVDAIGMGQIGIDSALADFIIAACPKQYKPNKNWLMSGEGDIFPQSVRAAANGETKMSVPRNDNTGALLESILAKQESLEKELQEIKALLMHKK